MGKHGWHGDISQRGFDPDIASVEARFRGPNKKPPSRELCTCAGEGVCDWCKTHCWDCGGTEDQHPVTEEYLSREFGYEFRSRGFEPHDFKSMGKEET